MAEWGGIQEHINHHMPRYSAAPWAQNQCHRRLWTETSEKMSGIHSSSISLLPLVSGHSDVPRTEKKAHTLCQRSGSSVVGDNRVQKNLWEKFEKFGNVNWGNPTVILAGLQGQLGQSGEQNVHRNAVSEGQTHEVSDGRIESTPN